MLRRALLVLLIMVTAVTPALARACLTDCAATEHSGMSTPQPDCHEEAPTPMPDDDERGNAAMAAACAFGAVAAPPALIAQSLNDALAEALPALSISLSSLPDAPPAEPPRSRGA